MQPLVTPFSFPLVRARFLQRRKRFFIDVALSDGATATAHTCNTGAMTGMLHAGAPVLLTERAATRAYPLELEAARLPEGGWIGANPIAANAFARACVERGLVAGLNGAVRREVQRGRSRFDLEVTQHGERTLVEVKCVTLRHEQRALFPDSPSERGARHLDALARFAKRGTRTSMLYVVVRDDCSAMGPAAHVDVAYTRAFRRAQRAGVVMRAVIARVDERGWSFAGALPVEPNDGVSA